MTVLQCGEVSLRLSEFISHSLKLCKESRLPLRRQAANLLQLLRPTRKDSFQVVSPCSMALVEGSDVARVNRLIRVEAKALFEARPPGHQYLRSRWTKSRDCHYFSERNVRSCLDAIGGESCGKARSNTSNSVSLDKELFEKMPALQCFPLCI